MLIYGTIPHMLLILFWENVANATFYVALCTFFPNVFIQYTKLLLYSHTKLKNLRNCEQRVVHNFILIIF